MKRPDMNDTRFIKKLRRDEILQLRDIDREGYPVLQNLSSAFLYRLLPVPEKRKSPEFVYVNAPADGNAQTILAGFMAQWNNAWEPAHLRSDMFYNEIPEQLQWLKEDEFEYENIYLLPGNKKHRYFAHQPLMHLIPAKTRAAYGIPLFKKGVWPTELDHWFLDALLPANFDAMLAQAFAFHIWPLLNKRSRSNAFSEQDPLIVLSHNLNYWMPYLHQVIEEILLDFPRVGFDNEKQEQECQKIQQDMPNGITVQRPRMGGLLWSGEDEAWEVTKKLIERADKEGQIRAIPEAVRSNRIVDDFSDKWSREKEDFERKMYHKRNKIKINFVEIEHALPVHSPGSEIHENLLWEDFITLLDKKEKRVVVCLKNGFTDLTSIGKHLGYANHSPISKTLVKIRKKAMAYFELT